MAEDLQRLASRLALLTSEDGEAENAGRAAGQLARRLGLSGGHLKAIFLAGVQAAGLPLPELAAAPSADQLARLEQEAAELRRLLDRSDDELQAVLRERASLLDENEALRESLDRSRSARQVWQVACVVMVVASLAGLGLTLYGPTVTMAVRAPVPAESALARVALAGPSGVAIRIAPELDAPLLARLPAGTSLPVRRLLWQGFRQWIETDAGGQTGYAPVTEVQLE